MSDVQPGNLVQVIDGAFAGMLGYLVSIEGPWARLRVGDGETILVNPDFIEAF